MKRSLGILCRRGTVSRHSTASMSSSRMRSTIRRSAGDGSLTANATPTALAASPAAAVPPRFARLPEPCRPDSGVRIRCPDPVVPDITQVNSGRSLLAPRPHMRPCGRSGRTPSARFGCRPAPRPPPIWGPVRAPGPRQSLIGAGDAAMPHGIRQAADEAGGGRLRQFTPLTDTLELAGLIENFDVVDAARGEVVDGGSALPAPVAVAMSVVDGDRCHPQGKNTEGDENECCFHKHGLSI
jgi:hypothetical protein